MLKKILISLVVAIALFLVFRDWIIKQAIVSIGSSIVGAPLTVGDFSLSLLTSRVGMKDVILYNPQEFTSNPLIHIHHIDVIYHPLALLTGQMHFSLIDLDVSELSIEHNKKGAYNVSSLKIKPQKSSSQPLDLKIELLKLNVDHVTLREEGKDGKYKESNHGIGLNKKTFKNINSPQQLVALVLFESSGLGPLKNIAFATTKEIVSELGRVTEGVAGTAKETVHSVWGSLKSVINK
ncbi:MAG: AsmA family protein [Candidatus Omnitrophica bacterium]|nr:AsmA family protein [Candidatus Omnitrophota bacterium]